MEAIVSTPSSQESDIVGKQAKLKKLRRSASLQPDPSYQPSIEADTDPTKFVQQLEKQGYQLRKIERSPSLPEQRAEPQL